MTESNLDNYLPRVRKEKHKPTGSRFFIFLNTVFIVCLLAILGIKLLSVLANASEQITGGNLIEFTRIIVFGIISRLGILFLLLLFVYDLFYFLRWTKSIRFTQNLICANCKGQLRRRHRKPFDQVMSKIFPTRRYGCKKCGSDFMIPKFVADKLGNPDRYLSDDEHEPKEKGQVVGRGDIPVYQALSELFYRDDSDLIRLLNRKVPGKSAEEIKESLKKIKLHVPKPRASNGHVSHPMDNWDADAGER